MQSSPTSKIVLNVGSGAKENNDGMLNLLFPDWRKVRLDVDPKNEPDIIGSLLDMSAVEDSTIDAIFSSHTIEHLYPNEIPRAIAEFLRVLRPDGFAVITCPDLQAAAQMIAEDKLFEVAYQSPAGPVTPFDIVYSHRMYTDRSNPHMAHHCGFTLKVLMGVLKGGGFAQTVGRRQPASFDLWVVATKMPMTDDKVQLLQRLSA